MREKLLTDRTLVELRDALVQRDVSAAEMAAASLDACERNPYTMTLITEERARREARHSDAMIRSGTPRPLEGVPAVYKDLFDFAGHVTTAGSRVLSGEPAAQRDADIVTLLRSAGAVTIGRTNMTELAFSGLGLNPHFGTPELADHQGVSLVPGGSSSGAAAALAQGVAPISIGTDTSGSIRIPACFHGLVGFKPTAGRYPAGGMVPLAPSLDSVGVIARSVADVRYLDGIISPSADSKHQPDITFVLAEGHLLEDLDGEVESCFAAAIGLLSSHGWDIRTDRISEIDAAMSLQRELGALVGMEAYRLHGRHLQRRNEMDARVARRLETSAQVSEETYGNMIAERTRLISSASGHLAGGDIILSPTVKCTSPELASLADDDAFQHSNARALANTMVANFFDWCSISVPCGRTKSGREVGLMLTGGKHQDIALLRIAELVEAVLARGMEK